MSITSSTELRAEILRLGTGTTDHGAIVRALTEKATKAELKVLAETALRDYVREVLGAAQRATVAALHSRLEVIETDSDEPYEPEPSVTRKPERKLYTSRSGRKFASAKMADMFDAYADFYAAHVYVKGATWRIGDLGAEQLRWLADSKRKMAGVLTAKADNYAKAADAMEKSSVKRVSDLDKKITRQLLMPALQSE